MIIYILLKRLKILLFLFPVFKWLLFTVLRSWQTVFKFGFFFPRIRRSFRILKGSEYTIFNCFWYFFLNCLRGKFIIHLTLTSHVLFLLTVYNLKLETAYKILSCFPFFEIRILRFNFFQYSLSRTIYECSSSRTYSVVETEDVYLPLN